jgi:HAD superfamily hydrolase (TIGR01549 family)
MVKAVIFDLDGTLLDTAPDLYLALKDTLEDYGVEPPPFEEFKKHIGGGAYGFLQPFLPSHLWEEALLKLRKYYLERYVCLHTKPFEGIPEVLKTLKREGFKLAVATNKITEGAIRVLERTGLLNYFDEIAGRDLPKEHKPSPEHILYITDKLKISSSETMVIGDRSDDVIAALRAGAFSGYALWGYTEPLPEDYRPHYLLKKPLELLEIVKNLTPAR